MNAANRTMSVPSAAVTSAMIELDRKTRGGAPSRLAGRHHAGASPPGNDPGEEPAEQNVRDDLSHVDRRNRREAREDRVGAAQQRAEDEQRDSRDQRGSDDAAQRG